MKINIGDVYYLDVTNPRTRITENRPVIIIDIYNEIPVVAFFATVTGSSIDNFEGKFDQWKVPLFHWQNTKDPMLKLTASLQWM